MKRVILAAAAAALVVPTVSACEASKAADDASHKDHKVVYEVTGTVRKASVTYTDGNTSTSQDTEAKVPWRKSIATKGSVIVYQVLAQNMDMGGSGGKISCKITVDGKVEAENTSKGMGAIATCNTQP